MVPRIFLYRAYLVLLSNILSKEQVLTISHIRGHKTMIDLQDVAEPDGLVN